MSSRERAADESTSESDVIFIQTNHDLLRQLARTYFEKRGRGYILITSSLEAEEREPDSYLLWYFAQPETIAIAEAESKAGLEEKLFHERVEMILNEYDPAQEFVLMLSEVARRSKVYRVRDKVVKHEMTLESAEQNDIPPL